MNIVHFSLFILAAALSHGADTPPLVTRHPSLVTRHPSLVTGRSGIAASPYGVCSHITRAGYGYRDESCAHIADTGIGAVRSDVDWHRCQPAPDAPFDFSFYDAVLASCEARGLRFLPILMRPPAWAKPIGEHLEEWGAFVEAFVRRC